MKSLWNPDSFTWNFKATSRRDENNSNPCVIHHMLPRSNIDQRCLFYWLSLGGNHWYRVDTLGKYLFHDFACKAIKGRKEPRTSITSRRKRAEFEYLDVHLWRSSISIRENWIPSFDWHDNLIQMPRSLKNSSAAQTTRCKFKLRHNSGRSQWPIFVCYLRLKGATRVQSTCEALKLIFTAGRNAIKWKKTLQTLSHQQKA